MYIAESEHTNNVYYIDTIDMVIDLWSFDEGRLLKSTPVNHQELSEFLITAFKSGFVKRSSKELDNA